MVCKSIIPVFSIDDQFLEYILVFFHVAAVQFISSKHIEPKIPNISSIIAYAAHFSSINIKALKSILLNMDNGISTPVNIIERALNM